MVKVKSLETIKKNYAAGATVAPERYKDGVKDASWKERAASTEAEDLFKAKMQEVIAEDRRRKGIERTSESEWKNAAMDKGRRRIGEGMRTAVEKQAARYAPFKSAVEGVTLPAKVADPMANVDNRCKPIVAVQVAKKKELLG